MSNQNSELAASKELKFSEIKIPVPWGHIAGKAWGKTSSRHVLAIHGIQDNCGVFDRLFSMLDGDYYIIAVDLPGHGYSSHFPAGVPLDFLNYILAIAYVVKALCWEQFIYLGHSFGGQIGVFFTAMYPNSVLKLIIIDHVAPKYYHKDELITSLCEWADSFMNLERRLKGGKRPSYPYEVALDKLTNRESSLTTESAKIVLERSTIKTPDGYSFCMDQRLKIILFPTLTLDLIKNVYQCINCPSLFLFSSARIKTYRSIFSEVFEIMGKKPNMTVKVIPGNHDVHQNHPDRLVKYVDEFLSTEQCKI